MTPTIISKKAGNWVDRGEPATPRLSHVLRHLLTPAELEEWAENPYRG